ncbi:MULTISPECIES: ABC transporter permease [unclassified Bosea (in: a-proteobacteria)]|uniref:ABC transporter permease n=1 Tax=unclassified Bosea (in: a-proteobacteria) TaxID=2653178 RepID=UPI000F75FE85|nr:MULTISPECIES: ABC transporter permease [unclassified Bosea (in: a-proteobacteria)]AZO80178.1 peptide ABC transporter permease [Bosea sp. Tri-49]RXT22970.1 peptide ABC transporter permease [Bosea sp. Tri-39]RXT38440.1 peptide ABC transporter permease [Bosea sp. Tri-54]
MSTAEPLVGRAALRRLLRHRSFVIGGVLVLAMVLVALAADLLSPFDPLRSNIRARLVAPDAAHWFGTDHFGRDILSRVMIGARISLAIGALTAILAGIAGTLSGAVAGFFPRLDQPIMRVMDALMAFPSIVLAMVVSAVLGASLTNVVIALAIATTPHTARIVRASVLLERELDYVSAARSIGAGELTILFKHVLRNAAGPLIVRLTYVFAIAVLAEAALSFVGAGPPPPAASFGSIIAQGRDFMREAPWITVFPGLAIIVCVLGLNLLGDGLRDVLDPRLKF